MDFIFVSLYLLVPVICFFILRASDIKITRISILSVVVLLYFLIAYLGFLPLYFHWDTYRYNIGINDKNIILSMFFYSSTSILLIVSSFFFMSKVVGLKQKETSYSPMKPLGLMSLLFVFFMFLVCSLVLLIYLNKVGDIALIAAITGKGNAELVRSNMGNNFHGKYHWYKLFFSDFLTFIAFVLFGNYLVKRRTRYFAIFLIVFLVCLFSAVMSTAKAPAAWFVIGLALIYMSVKCNYKINIRLIAVVIVLTLLVMVPAYMLFMGSHSIRDSLTSAISRSLTGQIAPAYFYLKLFPAYHDFLWGLSFPNPGGFLPFEYYNLSVEVMNYVFPILGTKHIVGSMPTAFWGEAYVNFGFLGPVIFSFVLGLYLYMFHILVSKLDNTVIKASLIVWLALHFKNINGTGIGSFIFDFYLYNVLIMAAIILFFLNENLLVFKTRYINRGLQIK